MKRLDFTDPNHPPPIPAWMRLGAGARTELLRRLPLRWSFALAAQTVRLTLPRKTRALAEWLRPLNPPGTSEAELHRQARWNRALTLVGALSQGPVYRRGARWLTRALRPGGLEHLARLKAEGSGVVLLGSHVGLFVWVSQVLWQLGYPHWLSQRLKSSADVILALRRDRLMDRVLPYPDPEGEGLHLRRMLGMLRRGEWLRHTGDIPDAPDGLAGRFLGRPVKLVRAPWALARLSGAPVVPVVIPMDRRLRPRLVVGAPISVSGGPGGEQAAFRAYLRFVADQVRDVPWNMHHYVWSPWFTGGRTRRPLASAALVKRAGFDPTPAAR